MKIVLAVSLAFSTAVVVLAFNLYQGNLLLKKDLVYRQEARAKLLMEISENTSESAKAEGEIERLRIDLLSANAQMTELAAQLRELTLLAEPGALRLRDSIRRELESEFVQEQIAKENNEEQVSMVAELSRLPPDGSFLWRSP